MTINKNELINSINSKLNIKVVETPEKDYCKKMIATDEEVLNGVLNDKVPTVKQLRILQNNTLPFSEEDISRMFES